MQETSIESYNLLKDTGRLGKLQKIVYSYLLEHPNSTQSEVAYELKKPKESVNPRFGELYSKGLIIETGKRRCKQTGMNVMTWKVIPKRDVAILKCPHCNQVIRKVSRT